jgi:hypothetical protein
MENIRKNINILLGILLILYSGLIDYNSSKFVLNLFKNAFFRIFILSVLFYKSKKNIEISILIGISLSVTMSFINNKELKEKYRIELA